MRKYFGSGAGGGKEKLESEKQFLETELAIQIEQAELEMEKNVESGLEQLVNPRGWVDQFEDGFSNNPKCCCMTGNRSQIAGHLNLSLHSQPLAARHLA